MRRVMRVLFSPGLREGFRGRAKDLRVSYLGKRLCIFGEIKVRACLHEAYIELKI